MTIEVQCKCGKKYRVRDEYAGRKSRCKACDTVMTIPSAVRLPVARRLDDTPRTGAAPATPPGTAGPLPEHGRDAPPVVRAPPVVAPPASAAVANAPVQLDERAAVAAGQPPSTAATPQHKTVPPTSPPPDAQVAGANAPAANAPAANVSASSRWLLHSHDGNRYGPVTMAELVEWHADGLLTDACQVCAEGGSQSQSQSQSQWQSASVLFPELAEDRIAPFDDTNVAPPVAAPVAPLAGALPPDNSAVAPPAAVAPPPAAGGHPLLAGYQPLLSASGKKKSLFNMAVNGELKKCSGVSLSSSNIYRVGERQSWADRLRRGTIIGPIQTAAIQIDQLQLFQLRDGLGEFGVIVPFDNGMVSPVQYVARLPGCLAAPLTLMKQSGGKLALEAGVVVGGPIGQLLQHVGTQVESVWVGCDGSVPPAALAANQQPALAEGLRWEGKVGGGPVSNVYRLDWGMQLLPLDSRQFLLVAHRVPRQKMMGFALGVDWFVGKRLQVRDFVGSLNCPQPGALQPFDPGVWMACAVEIFRWFEDHG